MFSGIIAEIGQVTRVDRVGTGLRLAISADRTLLDCQLGDSISVNGVCLTVAQLAANEFEADVMAVTAELTTLGKLAGGESVNLEPALTASSKLGGHIVQGHIDGLGEVLTVSPGQNWTTVRLALPAHLAALVAERGSIAVDGVSLTVSAVGADWFEVSLIPTTSQQTTLGKLAVGSLVNLESDVIARQVARYLQVNHD